MPPNSDSPTASPAEVTTVCLSPADERANILTHGCGFLLSIAAGAFLYQASGHTSLGLRISCLLFAVSLALVYLFSTLSHAVYEPRRRNRLRAWDQGTIYLLIVGTYTPFIWQGSQGSLRWGLLIACWAAAAFGFFAKVHLTHRVNAVSTATYLALGWLPALALVSTTPRVCVQWMLIGGLCYSVGVLFLKLSRRVLFAHAAWHCMVIAGSACHVYAIWQLTEYA